jgi:hypothetical protein
MIRSAQRRTMVGGSKSFRRAGQSVWLTFGGIGVWRTLSRPLSGGIGPAVTGGNACLSVVFGLCCFAVRSFCVFGHDRRGLEHSMYSWGSVCRCALPLWLRFVIDKEKLECWTPVQGQAPGWKRNRAPDKSATSKQNRSHCRCDTLSLTQDYEAYCRDRVRPDSTVSARIGWLYSRAR